MLFFLLKTSVILLVLGVIQTMSSSMVSAKDVNLTAITWAHAVNTKDLLAKALKSKHTIINILNEKHLVHNRIQIQSFFLLR